MNFFNSSEDDQKPDSDSSPPPKNSSSAWSFGGLMKTLSTKSESVLQTYREDLKEFTSGLNKETSLIGEVTSRALKNIPSAFDAGIDVARVSLESIGQAADDIGGAVWRGTAEVISHGKEVLLADQDSDSDDQVHGSSSNVLSKRFSRFESQVNAIQSDLSTYCEDPEDLEDFDRWKLGFELGEKGEEIERLLEESEVMEGVYAKLVPSSVDDKAFWTRYFYRVYKVKLVEDARANLVKRAIAGEKEEDLSWDVEDDEDGGELSGVSLKKVGDGESQGGSGGEVVAEVGGASGAGGIEKESTISGNVGVDEKSDHSVSPKKGKIGSCKDSDISIISSQPSMAEEEEDLSWDEIEDISSIDEKKGVILGSPNKVNVRRPLSAADDDEDLSWD